MIRSAEPALYQAWTSALRLDTPVGGARGADALTGRVLEACDSKLRMMLHQHADDVGTVEPFGKDAAAHSPLVHTEEQSRWSTYLAR